MPSKAKKPNLVAKYIEEVRDLTSGPGTYAYRGQGNSEWGVESAASRRIQNTWGTPPDMETFIRYHEDDLLAPARMDGYGTKNGRELRDLELLAELQHFGAATCLMDFTTNFLAALWFACSEGESTEKNDGKVFILNINNEFRSLNHSDLKQEIRPIIETVNGPSGPSYWYWSPHGMNQRILKQDSMFVFGKTIIDNDRLKSISVKKEDKKNLLKELGNLGISRKSLFKDLPGFASANAHLDLIPRLKASAQGLFLAGNDAYQQGDWGRAIRLYNDSEAKGFPQKAVLLRARGLAKIHMGAYDSASEDYTKSMEHEPSDFNDYYYRGVAKFFMENYSGSVKDLTKALNMNSDSTMIPYRRALTYEKMGKITEMRADLKHALQLAQRDEDNRLIQIIQEKLAEYEDPHDDIPF